VNFASGDGNPSRDGTTQINKRMHLDCCLGLSELGPWEQRQAQVDGCRVKGIQRLLQLNGNRFTLIKTLSRAYQNLAKVLKDAPVPAFVGISKSRSGNITTESDVVEFFLMRVQASFNIPQTLATGQLGICQAEELIIRGELLGPMLSMISINAEIKLVPWQILKKLLENRFAGMHWHPPEISERYHSGRIQIEKRTVVSKNIKL